MANAEYDTPADLGTLGRDLGRVLEGLGANWDEGRSLVAACARSAGALDDHAVRSLAEAAAVAVRETNATAVELGALLERIGRGGPRAITVRDLRIAPPASRRTWRRFGVGALRGVAAVGAGLFAMSEAGGTVGATIPHWLGIAGGLAAFAAAGVSPGLIGREK